MDSVYRADAVWLLDIQRKLYGWSRSETEGAYREVWNWVTDPRNLRLAWRRDALEHIRNAIRPTGAKTGTDWPRPPCQWVIEGDIKGCFDNIDHHHVLTRLRRRVADTKVCRLVRAFLKAGILSEDAFLRTETGTPQGGVLSPLLANITLSAIEERYATYVAPRKTRGGAP